MNYEKKYKSALEWMRSIYPTMQGADKEDAEHYFPELRESEDERIRKTVLKMITNMDGGYPFEKYGIIKKDAIAWLEKQGEQSSWSEEDERHRKRIIERLEDIRKSKEDNIDVVSVILSEINWLKSIKPQPKYKWTDEDEKT